MPRFCPLLHTALVLSAVALPASAGKAATVAGIPLDFILFALTLLGVALIHKYTLYVGLIGLATITLYKLLFAGFKIGDGAAGLKLCPVTGSRLSPAQA